MRKNDLVRRARHLAQVWRWRVSKALGVPGLEQLRWGCLIWGGVSIAAGFGASIDALQWVRDPEPAPITAIWNVWVQLGIMVVSALISYAMRPKTEVPAPTQRQQPEVEDGTAIREVFGPVWITEPMELAWRALPEVAIRKKGGKK